MDVSILANIHTKSITNALHITITLPVTSVSQKGAAHSEPLSFLPEIDKDMQGVFIENISSARLPLNVIFHFVHFQTVQYVNEESENP